MVLAYVFMLILLTTTQATGVNTALHDISDAENQALGTAPMSPPRKPKVAATPPTSPAGPLVATSAVGSPTRTPTRPIAKPSPGRSPWGHKVTPGRPGNPRDNGSRIVVRTDRTPSLASQLATSGLMPSPVAAPQPQSVFMTDLVKLELNAECEAYLRDHQILLATMRTKLTALGATSFDVTDLYPEEVTFWDNALVGIDERVITKMLYRRLLGVTHDRENASPTSASFNGKNKKNVFDHAFVYEFLCRILTSPYIHAYKMIYQTDLSDAKDGSMRVAYEVVELHYPTELTYIKSPDSPVGGKPTDDEVATDLGTRTSVIAFSQAREALIEAYKTATPRVMDDGETVPFIANNRFNWIFHAQHQKDIADGLTPVQVQVIIAPDAFGRRCLELVIIDDNEAEAMAAAKIIDFSKK